MAEYEPRSLRKWMKKIRSNAVALPEFQRGFVWEEKLVANLFRSLLLRRPVGVLLLLSPSPKTAGYFKSRNFPNVVQQGTKLRELVLDGQQRLTSIWQALQVGPRESGSDTPSTKWEHEFFVKLVEQPGGKFKFDDVVYEKRTRVRTPKELLQDRRVPLNVLGFDGITQQEYALDYWCVEACENVANRALEVRQAIEESTRPLRKSRLWFTSLGEDLSREECIDMFVTVNESNTKVSHFDIAVAEFSKPEDAEAPRDQIEEWLSSQSGCVRPFLSGVEDDDIRDFGVLMLRIACLRKGETPTVRNYKNKVVQKEFSTNFTDIGNGISYFYDLVVEDGVNRRDLLPSEAPLQVVAALYPTLKELKKDRAGEARALLRSYVWQAFLTTRYSLGTNDRLKNDYQSLFDILNNTPDGQAFDSFKLPNSEVASAAEMARLDGVFAGVGGRSSLLRAFLAISSRDARDFATGAGSIGDQVGVQHRHHLFPKKFLRDNLECDAGLNVRRATNHVLNYALIDGFTNTMLGAKSPKEYLEERKKKQPKLDAEEFKRRIESHAIPYDYLNVDKGDVRSKYEQFLKRRAEKFARIVEKLVGRDIYKVD